MHRTTFRAPKVTSQVAMSGQSLQSMTALLIFDVMFVGYNII